VIVRRIDVSGPLPVVVHTADHHAAEQLHAMVVRLRSAAHPGVVRVLAVVSTDAGVELRTEHGGAPLDQVGALEPARLAAIGAAVATTLAELHELGVVHGRLTGARVLIGPHDRPMLCGFGTTPPAGGGELDVAALGELLTACAVGRHAVPGPVAPPLRSLVELCSQACDPSASRRPSMRRFAASLAALAVPARVVRRPARRATPRSAGRSSRLLVPVGVAIVILAIGAWRLQPPPRAAAPVVASPTTAARAPSAPMSTTSTSRTTIAGTCAVVTGSDGPSIEGCPHEISLQGTTVTIDGASFEVGTDGDVIAVGSWRCAGDATIAVLRPATGSVFAFPTAATSIITVEPIATVRGGRTFVVTELGRRCQELRVVDAGGTSTPIELRPRA
jgi:hypothetical protein